MERFLLIMLLVIIWCITGYIESNYIDYTLTPLSLYKNTKLNWFGTIFIYLLISIASPILFLAKIIYKTLFSVAFITVFIVRFIKWLFTVGRRDY